MGLTSTTIIREYIEKNVAEFDRTILEKKDEYRGILDSKNTDIILLPSGEEIVVSYADISITGSDRAKPQIRVFMDKTRVSYQYAKTNQKRFFLFTIFSKDNAMAKNISNYDPHDYIVAIETNIDNETSRRDLRSMYDFLDEYIGAGKESDFVRCANGFHQSGIYQASFIKIQENGIVKTDAFKNYITYFDSRPYMNSVVDSISNELKKDDNNTYNRIIFGAPGTGKSHKLEEDSKQFGENTERVTFHPNYSYAQFVGTYKPIQGENPTDIKYEYVPGPFMRTYVNALNNPEKKFLLLIEEINRANVAAVFGDVFQLLDRKNGVSEYPIATSEDIKKHLLENLDCLKDKDINEAGLHFWKLVNQLFFDNELVVESKGSNQGLLDALIDLETEDGDEYFVAFDYVVDNQDIRNKYRMLKSITDTSEGKIVILDMICFEYLILAFDKLVEWTGTGKTDKIKIRDKVLAAVENHRIDLSRIDDKKTLQYIAGFKRYSTERVIKSLVGEFTQNEKWSVKGTLMGECWYKDCCVSEHPDNLRCGKPEVECGDEKMRMLIQSETVRELLKIIHYNVG